MKENISYLIEKEFELIRELRESQKKTDEQFRKTDEKINKIWTQLGNLGLVQGQITKDLFYRNVEFLFRKREIEFSSVIRNIRKKELPNTIS